MPTRRACCLSWSLLACSPLAHAESDSLQVVTGNLPPFAVEGADAEPGMLVELTEALLAQAGWPVKVQFYPWARAMQTALHQPRTLILPLTRTPEREAQYQWLVRLYVQRFVFITRKGMPKVAQLAQAQGLRVVVLRGSPNVAQLQRHGFADERITQATTVVDMLRMLELGMVDAIYGGDLVNLSAAVQSGRDPTRFELGLLLESGEVWLAASSGVTEAEAQRLQAAHQALVRNGVQDKIFGRYRAL